MTEVEIHEIHATHEGDVLTLALSGAVDGDRVHLILSFAFDERPAAQEIELGLSGVHVEWIDQAHSGYNLIQSARWSGSDLVIDMTKLAHERGIPEAMLLRKATSHLADNDRTFANAILANI